MPNSTEPDDLAQLARLRVAAVSGRLAPDLAAWAIQRLSNSIGRTAARHQWVFLLRRAAAGIEGSTRNKARVLAALVVNLQQCPNIVESAGFLPNDVVYIVREALRIEPNMPTSSRQLRRLIE